MPTSDPGLDHLIRTAIEQTKLLRLRYRNKLRIVEPHDYGVHNGVTKLLTWQIGGASSSPLPNWRWMETDLISEAQMLDRTFPAAGPPPPANTISGTSSTSESDQPTLISGRLPYLTHLCRKLTKHPAGTVLI